MSKPTTVVFAKTVDGQQVTQVASIESDKVRYTFEGWRDITADVAAAQEVAKQIAAASAKPADSTVKK